MRKTYWIALALPVLMLSACKDTEQVPEPMAIEAEAASPESTPADPTLPLRNPLRTV